MSEILIMWVVSILQVLIAVGLLNVWIVRSGHTTKYRGGKARNMKEEFAVYGLPKWFMYVIGFLKVVIAIVTLMSAFVPSFMYPLGIGALMLLVLLMLGALSMHLKIHDRLVKMLPALTMLSMAVIAIALTRLV